MAFLLNKRIIFSRLGFMNQLSVGVSLSDRESVRSSVWLRKRFEANRPWAEREREQSLRRDLLH